MQRLEYEVFGKVQGVFFRKYTKKEADKLKLTGWVMNTEKGTVVGVADGPETDLKQFQNWLKNTGSPKSRIDRTSLKELRPIEKSEFPDFTIRR